LEIDMEKMDPVYESGMRPFEFAAIKYELPKMIGAVIIALVIAVVFRYIVVNLDLYPPPRQVALMVGIVDLAALWLVLWGASYYPKRITVLPDRISFKMLISSREVPASNIDSIERLSREEARRTFAGFRFHNLSPAVNGAVVLKRRKGRPWVFSPADPEALIAAVEKVMGSEEESETGSDNGGVTD
jgi:hypothetical protein